MSDDAFTPVALVTRGNSGIGQAVALAFANAGAHVVIGARRVKEGEAVAKQIIAGGGQAIFVQSDVSRAPEVESLVDAAVKTFGRLDWACSNAGEEIAEGVLWLCSDKASYITGTSLVVDGGVLA